MERDTVSDPVDLIKAYYSDPSIVKSYTTVGLWPSEERIIDKFFTPGSSILDMGCGTGRTSIPLAKKGYDVTGIDLIPEMIKVAKDQAQSLGVTINFMVMDATKLDFPRESFQNVFFSFNGLEQIPGKMRREKVLQNICKILKPAGHFILTTRSGLAIGRRSIAWVVMTLKYLFERGINKKDRLEFGDKVWKGSYNYYFNPFTLRTRICNIGFQMIYFNSNQNVENKLKPTIFTNFSHDISLFYVFRKKHIR